MKDIKNLSMKRKTTIDCSIKRLITQFLLLQNQISFDIIAQ